MLLFDYLYKYSIDKKDFPILEDEIYGTLSYQELEEYTGKVYNYLLTKSFKNEQIIVIRVKRSYRTYLAMLGIWKRGLPFVVIGDHSPNEYVNQVLDECGSEYIFDDNELDLALSYPYLKGYKEVNEHDLACVVYSTGSSGFFKGSMHEFGAVELLFKTALEYSISYKWEYKDGEINKLLCLGGFYSLTPIVNFIDTVAYLGSLVIISYEHCTDIDYLIDYCRKNKIYSIDCSPKTIGKFIDANIDTLKEYVGCYEMFSIKYIPGKTIYNCYGMSESFFTLSYFFVDKDYDLCPIGKSMSEHKLVLLDESDNIITSPKQIGEFAFIPLYYRGYIKHPELYQKVFYNGHFHTGDMGYLNEDENFVCVGRKADLYKLDQNKYIIPVFISIATKKCFQDISKCYIKIFKEDSSIIVALYYVSNQTHTLEEINNKIKDLIPEYMLPTHIEKVDDLHYFFCGKVNKHLFKKPEN